MAIFPEAMKRMFENVWVCMNCNAKNRGPEGGKPDKCRKCNSKRLRLKRSKKKK